MGQNGGAVGSISMGTRWGSHSGILSVPSLIPAEKKLEQEELKLERARDSSEGEFPGHRLRAPQPSRGCCAHLLHFQAATLMGTRHGEALAPAGTLSCRRLASSNVPSAPARWVPGISKQGSSSAPPEPCACSPQGTTGEVHCEKVQCPRLTCANPVRVSPSDCCKQCPGTCSLLPSCPLCLPHPVGMQPPCALSAAPEKSIPELTDGMQADGPRACRFGRRWYLNNESWHPSVPPFGEMKCILCWCVVSVLGMRRCPLPP